MTTEHANPPQAIGVYGIAGHTLSLLELCRRNQILVEFVVDDEPERFPGLARQGWKPDDVRSGVRCQTIPIWSRTEFTDAVAARVIGVPLFAASIASEPGQNPEDDPFLRATAEVQSSVPGSPMLWHPASLADSIAQTSCPGRIALFGFRGSGNVLAQAIAAHVLGGTTPHLPDVAAWVAVFTEHLYLTTANLIRHRLSARVPIVDIQFTPEEFPSMFVTVTDADGGMAVVKHIPSNRHYAEPFYWTHSTPSNGALAAFGRLNISTVAIVRHPAETLLALASKIARPPRSVIDDMVWLDHHAQTLAVWMKRLLSNRRTVHIVRYEDLTNRNTEELRRLVEVIGVQVAPSDLDSIYNAVLFRDLVPNIAPGHFNRGGSDKWKRYFGRRHRDLLIRNGLSTLAETFGYDRIDSDVEAQPQMGTQPARPLPTQFSAAVTHRFFSDPEWERLPGVVPHLLRATSPALGEALTQVLLSDELCNLHTAGGMGTKPPPWVLPINWYELETAMPLPLQLGATRVVA